MTTPDAKRRDTTKATQASVINHARRRAARYLNEMANMPVEVWKDGHTPLHLVEVARLLTPAPERKTS
jgi:hypothetical protein